MNAHQGVRLALGADGRGWFRTSDLSRVKRATARILNNYERSCSLVKPNRLPSFSLVFNSVFGERS